MESLVRQMVFIKLRNAVDMRGWGLLIFLVLFPACTDAPERPLLVVAASMEQMGAVVIIDGEEVGCLKRQSITARLIDKIVQQPDFFPDEVVSLSVGVSEMAAGPHVIEIVNNGEQLRKQSFSVPLSEDVLIFVLDDATPEPGETRSAE